MSAARRTKKALFGKREQSAKFAPALFFSGKIRESIGTMDGRKKYEDPLEDRLAHDSLGHVSGGGSQLGDERPDGTRPIEFCGIDVDVTVLAKALVVLREELVELQTPVGTE